MTVVALNSQCSLYSHSIHSIQRFSSKTDITNNSYLSDIPHSTIHKNKNKNKFISEQKMKFDDNEILLINILLETHTMGTTAIT